MLSGSRPTIASASAPTALTRLSLVESATTDGSESTIPRPFTYTSTFAVPRSIPIFRAIHPPILDFGFAILDYAIPNPKSQIQNPKSLLSTCLLELGDPQANHR